MKIIKYLLILIIILTICGCKKTAPPVETIKIGVVYPQSGEDKNYGALEGNGYTLAADMINSKGGIKGKKIELISKDDFSSEQIALGVTEELIEQDKVAAILGTFDSRCTFSMSKLCNEKKVPLVCSSGAVDDVTNPGNEWTFRLCSPSRYYAIDLIDFLLKEYPPATIGIIYNKGFFSSCTYKYLKKYIKEKNIKSVVEETYTKGMINFKPMLKKIKAKNPDLLYIIAYKEDAPLLLKQAKEINLNPKIYAGAGIGFTDPFFISSADHEGEYVITVSQWDKSMGYKGSNEFIKEYEAKFGYESDYHGVLAYTGLIVLADALNRAENITREDIKKSLKETRMNTILGPIKFEDYDGFTNQNKHNMVVLQIQNGEAIPVYPNVLSKKKVILPVPKWNERKKTSSNR